ncbi:DnaA ATPase domain-containing protein [Mycoplasmopsis lipofaciens]|uniref:DnaA ATPase domain-containing protein n=1 Tax=Mycoplasmopsis lipofaciens TaxID=114884 RepID=UPI0005695836|nr:ATP-binding protein [Mycoplasmopsis lipofaciens]
MKKEIINDKLFFKTKSEFENKALQIIHSHRQIEDLIISLDITDQEILDNLLNFINLKESLDNSEIYPWFYNVTRKNNKLIFKKYPAKNNYKLVVTKQMNLWLTEISEPDPDASIEKIRTSSKNRKQLYSQIITLTKAINKKKHKGFKGLYVYGQSRTGKTYIAHAMANYCASEGVTTSYISAPLLYSFLIKNIKNNVGNINDDVINKMKESNMLIIDEIGLEKNSFWFRFEILLDIIESRLMNNKITVFVSPMSQEELNNYYLNQDEKEIYKAKSFISKIINNSEQYCIDEISNI